MADEAAGRAINVELLNRLRDIVGGRRVSRSELDAVNYARDLWPREILKIRAGTVKPRPALVVWPETTEEVSRIVRVCSEMFTPIIPFGAGSGLAGAVAPVCGGLILDTKRMDRIERLSEQSNIAVCQTGILGVHLERQLNRRGYTLGHFPGSLGTSTLGGYLATSSGGIGATRYGKIEDMLVSMQVVLADGTVLHSRTAPRRATGPNFDRLFLGSEGTLGVITRAHLRVHLLPEARLGRGFAFDRMDDALECIRKVMRVGLRPTFARLSDAADTVHTLRPLGINTKGSLLVLIFTGREVDVEIAIRRAQEIARQDGARDHGEEPANLWYEHRYAEHYRQSPLFAEAGTVSDTIEVAVTWRHVGAVYEAIHRAAPKGIEVLTHFPAFYPEGCAMLCKFTGKARAADADLELYDRVWAAALPAIVAAGGVVSHQHGIGKQKIAWWRAQAGPNHRLLAAVKQRLDPHNILNPGKLASDAEAPC